MNEHNCPTSWLHPKMEMVSTVPIGEVYSGIKAYLWQCPKCRTVATLCDRMCKTCQINKNCDDSTVNTHS